MALSIDTSTYNRTIRHAIRDGYQSRGGLAPTSIVVHTTNNAKKNTSFSSEADWLCNAPNVSCHYLIGKAGQIALIVPPLYQAWHAGEAMPEWTNPRSIGIEMHVSVGETPTSAQLDALTALVRQLMNDFQIAPQRVETHRYVALPHGRKSDPEGFPDAAFYAWRTRLTAPVPEARVYRVTVPAWWLETPSPIGPIALNGTALLAVGDVVTIDQVKDGWAHAANGVGFCPIVALAPM